MANARVAWLLVALPGVLLLCLRAWQEAWLTDDALIAFRYLEHFVAGDGLVFNVGERVEGFSNPLFLFVLAPFVAAGVDPIPLSQGVGMLASVVELLLLVWVVLRTTESLPLAGGAGLFFASDRIAIVWATGGLETAFHGALLFGAFAATLRAWEARDQQRRWNLAAFLHALVALSRPEGIAFCGLLLLAVVLAERRSGGVRRALRTLPYVAIPVGVALVARLLYYGRPFANTYYAKVAGVPTVGVGFEYLAGFLRRLGLLDPLHAPVWILLVGAVAVALYRHRITIRKEHPRMLEALGLGLLYLFLALAIVVWTGGDYMNDFRMLRPVLGILWLTVALSVGVVLRSELPRAPALAAALAALLLVSHLVRQNEGSALTWDAPPAAEHKDILAVDRAKAERFASALEVVAREGDSLLVDLAGFRGYGHRFRTHDATGLVSADPVDDFYLRDEWNERTGGRERLPGHARWPKVSTMEREEYTFIFPKVQSRGPEIPEITERSVRRHRGYPFLHVVVPLNERLNLRFFTTLDRAALRERAARIERAVCWRESGGPLECAGPGAGTLPAE